MRTMARAPFSNAEQDASFQLQMDITSWSIFLLSRILDGLNICLS